MRAAFSSTCSECGYTPRNAELLLRSPRRWRWAVVGLLVALALPTYVVARRTKQHGWDYYLTLNPAHYFFGTATIDELEVRGVTFRLCRDRRLNVYQNSAWIEVDPGPDGDTLRIEGYRLWIGYDNGLHSIIGRGENITGNGRPNVIVAENSGGTHCCQTNYVFEIQPDSAVRQIARIEAEHGGDFEDRDGDGYPEFVSADWFWAYTGSCFACLRYPQTILKFDGRTFAPAPELMRTATPDESIPYEGTRGQQLDSPDRIRTVMLHMVYTGHAAEAWKRLDEQWSDDWGDRRKELQSFQQLLVKSPWWPTVVQLNPDDPVCLALEAGRTP